MPTRRSARPGQRNLAAAVCRLTPLEDSPQTVQPDPFALVALLFTLLSLVELRVGLGDVRRLVGLFFSLRFLFARDLLAAELLTTEHVNPLWPTP